VDGHDKSGDRRRALNMIVIIRQPLAASTIAARRYD
jgi:hypothetical protein